MSRPVTVTLSPDEALVLFEWLARFNAEPAQEFEHPAEPRVLWSLENSLESILVEPLDPGYRALLDAARARLVAGDEPS
jgi:hypothetical protein